MRRLLPTIFLLFSCGGAQTSAPATTGPSPEVTVLGIARRVAMLDVALPVGAVYEAPASRCQDTMLLVREGVVRVAPENDQELRLGVRGAIRFGATRPATVRAMDGVARILVVVARPMDAPFDETRGRAGIEQAPERCGHDAAAGFEIASASDVGPFPHAEGRLLVSLFLDARANQAALASLGLLEGTPDVAVPRHAHEISDEVLFIESGEGTMMRGDARIPVRGPQFVWVPAGMPHGLERSGSAPLVAYQVYAPAGPEQRFRRPTP